MATLVYRPNADNPTSLQIRWRATEPGASAPSNQTHVLKPVPGADEIAALMVWFEANQRDLVTGHPRLIGRPWLPSTFATVAAEYLALAHSWEPGSRAKATRNLANHITPFWGERAISSITAVDFNERFDTMTNLTTGTPMKRSSRLQVMEYAIQVVGYACDMGYTAFDPRAAAKRRGARVWEPERRLSFPRAQHAIADDRDPLSLRELVAWLAWMPAADDELRLAVEIMGVGGCRIGEVAAFDCGALNRHGDLVVGHTLTPWGRKPGTKSARADRAHNPEGKRFVALPTATWDRVTAWIAGRPADAPMFPYAGRFTDPQRLRAAFKRSRDAAFDAGILDRRPGLVPHTMRHTMATLLKDELPGLMFHQRMGHAVPGLPNYTHHRPPDHVAKERAILDEVLKPLAKLDTLRAAAAAEGKAWMNQLDDDQAA